MPSAAMPFKRGTTFSYLLKIPDTVEDGFFSSWKPTAQLRREKNDSAAGLIAEFACAWDNPAIARHVLVHHNMTEKWPLGNAELDILLTSAGGQTIRSRTLLVNIQRGITR